MNLNESNLINKIMELNSENKKLETMLNQERLTVGETRASLNKLTAVMKCPICIAHDVSHVMAPCGHTICHECLKKLNRNR